MVIKSVQVNTTQWGSDFVTNLPTLNLDVTQGVIVSAWYQMPDPGATWSRGTDAVAQLVASNWSIRFYAGGSSFDGSQTGYVAYSQFFASGVYIGNYAHYDGLTNDRTVAELKGWQGMAWRTLKDATSFTLQTWLQFGLNGTVLGAYSTTLLLSDIRVALVAAGWSTADANAWVPSNLATDVIYGAYV